MQNYGTYLLSIVQFCFEVCNLIKIIAKFADMSGIGKFFQQTLASVKSVAKLALHSRRCRISKASDSDQPIIIMGNGPSLADTMRDSAEALRKYPLMAVNFAANAEEFYRFRPTYYVLADPVFFQSTDHPNVARLWENLTKRIDWGMTLYVPMKFMKTAQQIAKGRLNIEGFNMIGVEGYGWLENAAYSSGRGMPRPRNVLIVAIMVAMKMGYREIYLTGADHSWTRTLEVDEDNIVVSVQPHFYKDNDAERQRVASVYKNIRLHELLLSFHIAFKAYFAIARYARRRNVEIYNSTPGSFIDAFPRRALPKTDRG